MKRTVTVLQEDIDNGEPRKPSRCMVSLAVRRDLIDLLEELPEGVDKFTSVTTCTDKLYVCDLQADLPAEVSDRIRRFDSYPGSGVPKEIEPFKFEIDLEPMQPPEL